MADTKMQESKASIVSEQHQSTSSPSGEALAKLGGFMAVKGFIPAAADMNPDKKATKATFLTDTKYRAKREALANELRGWIEVLGSNKNNAVEYVDECKSQVSKYTQLIEKNVTNALDTIKTLETTYRSLDMFFKNANDDKLNNLRLINVNRDELENESSTLSNQVDELLKNGYDRLSLKDSYSLMVIPGYHMQDKPTLLKWAKIAHKYKVMLITDHDKENSFDSLRDDTANYKDSDIELQNVIMCGNWIAGREKELLSVEEKESDDKAFFIPPSTALAGRLYDETAVMSQGAAGKKFGTLSDVKGVELDLLKSEIASLMDNQIVPMVYSEGRVMAFNNNNLYNGDNAAMREYPVVRVFDWIKKVLMNFVHEVALENWDSFNSPQILRGKITDFLNRYQGYGNLFESYNIKLPTQDPVTKRISVDIDIKPYVAAKNFTIKLSADKKDKSCEDVQN